MDLSSTLGSDFVCQCHLIHNIYLFLVAARNICAPKSKGGRHILVKIFNENWYIRDDEFSF